MVDLSPTTSYVADANLFIRAGTPKRIKAKALIDFFSRSHWTLLVHPDVEDELTHTGRQFPRHRTLQKALDIGWAEIRQLPDDPIAPIHEILDASRECIAKKTNRLPHQIEDADVNIVGLAASLVERESTDVGIITNDSGTGRCFDVVLPDFGYEQAEYVDAKELLGHILDWYNQKNS